MKKLFLLLLPVLLLCSCNSVPEQNVSSESILSSQIQSEISSLPSSSEVEEPEDPTGFNVNESGLPILLFHHLVKDEYAQQVSGNSIIHTESQFEAQIKILYDNGYKAVSHEDAIAFLKGEKTLRRKSVLITFDDGYKSNIAIAAPILRKYGYKAILFSMTRFYDVPDMEYNPDPNAWQYINKTDIEKNTDVFFFACHGHDKHIDYTTSNKQEVIDDITICKEKLNGCEYIAYPIGKHNEAVRSFLRELGFKYGFSTYENHAKPGIDLMRIPRYTIFSHTTPEKLLSVVEKRQ
ncbi:MAG: hypothetical protein E7480_07930 [Ruminococcaceae bacterium]|nr:hypothetical protein [Oscillospiraceae bacterium]